jgi:DNA-binding response OmpR family regulator
VTPSGVAPASAASAASAAALQVITADPVLRSRIERALATELRSGPLVVTTDVTGVAGLRVAQPAARVVVVGVRRAQVAAALDAGADAVLAGLIRPAELRARVRVLARRTESRWTVGALVLDTRARTALLDGADLGLPRREFALLCCLASAPGRVFSKAELLRSCWETGACSPSSRTLERQAARLRRRLGRHAPMLVTVWGIGYRLDEPA